MMRQARAATLLLWLPGLASALENLFAVPAPQVTPAAVAPRSMLTCNQDNCLRAYEHSMTAQIAFCYTYIESTSTETVTPTVTISGTDTIVPPPTNYPTLAPVTIPSHISSRCVDVDADATPLPFRLSSACSCISAPAATVTTTIVAPAVTTTIPTGPVPCNGIPNPYTAPDGKQFQVNCDSYYYDGGSNQVQYLYGLPDFESCINSCANADACVAADFGANIGGISECALLSNISFGGNSGYESALLLAPAP